MIFFTVYSLLVNLSKDKKYFIFLYFIHINNLKVAFGDEALFKHEINCREKCVI